MSRFAMWWFQLLLKIYGKYVNVKKSAQVTAKCDIAEMRKYFGMVLMDFALSDIVGGPLVCYDNENL